MTNQINYPRVEQHNTAQDNDSKETQQVMLNKQSNARMKMMNYPRAERDNTAQKNDNKEIQQVMLNKQYNAKMKTTTDQI